MGRIFLDMDGVICDFNRGYLEHFGWTESCEAVRTWGWPVDKYKTENPGKTEGDFWREFGFLFWAQLHKTKEANVILCLVKKFRPVILTTAALYSPGVYDGKASWLRRHLPEYYNEGRFLIGGTKHQLAGPDKLLIDDSEANCIDWCANGGKAIMVPRPWNKRRGESVYNAVRHGLQIGGDTYGI